MKLMINFLSETVEATRRYKVANETRQGEAFVRGTSRAESIMEKTCSELTYLQVKSPLITLSSETRNIARLFLD